MQIIQLTLVAKKKKLLVGYISMYVLYIYIYIFYVYIYILCIYIYNIYIYIYICIYKLNGRDNTKQAITFIFIAVIKYSINIVKSSEKNIVMIII